MRDQTIGGYLDDLADRIPAPGGGAVAALHAAQSAGLIAMVARYTTGERYAAHAAEIGRILAHAEKLRHEALALAEQDAAAFGAVAAAYRLPKNSEKETSTRSAAIAAALLDAARPPAAVIATAEAAVALARDLVPIGNRNVLTDVAAAADAARAAVGTARLNVEVNLAGVRDEQARRELRATLGSAEAIIGAADAVSAAVREMIAR